MSWDNVLKEAEKATSGTFVRLKADGDSIVGAFVGDPFAQRMVWTGEGYDPFDPELHDESTAAMKIAINFYVPAEKKMKVIQGGAGWFKDVNKCRDKYGLDKRLFEVQRHGLGTKTKYSILPDEEIKPELAKEIAGQKLHDLKKVCTQKRGE